jgi:Transposase, Mutator family
MAFKCPDVTRHCGSQRRGFAAVANRESRSSWKDFLLGLRKRGLNGVEFVVADDHAGLRSAVREVLTEVAFQAATSTSCATPSIICPARPTTTDLQELRWLYDRRSIEEAARTSPHGSPNGEPAIPNSSDGSKRPSRKPSPSTGSPASTISISRAPTCWSASTRRSKTRRST